MRYFIAFLLIFISIQANASQYDAELLRLTNAERSKQKLPALTLNTRLGEVAQKHAEDMAKNRYFSHTGKDGSTPSSRLTAAGYAFYYVGENIAAGNATPAATIEQWMNSTGHRANILGENYTEIGFGYFADPNSPYRHYWVQLFAKGKETIPETTPIALTKANNLFNRIEKDYNVKPDSTTLSSGTDNETIYYRLYFNGTAGLVVYKNGFYLAEYKRQWFFKNLGSLEEANRTYCDSKCW
ncbi:CAP domain-containing protein [Thioflexithrix psekupsensis]|uniref:SCP domain-containing protein n=1 Tax=Thioflexithrix psekupsensis TaxID=1570016 RepID=A0A251XD43_9GAMM|nr:CAP domain-containing protein [Thioflexithrix psekupsensis]OUD16251.1 hypothetical protein TPSD3_00570 [Thioflexithrix psekupsensis]